MENNELYVLEIYNKKSITRAAKQLNISQPSLSISLASLEKKIGFEIFDRTKNPLEITEEGSAYISYLLHKKELELDLESRISDIRSGQNLVISIGAPSSYVKPLIIPAISEYITENPGAKFSLTEGTVPFLEGKMQNGELDMFISTANNGISEFNYESLFTETTFVCVNSRSKWASYKSVSIAELKDEKFILLQPAQPLQEQIDDYLSVNNLTLNSNIRADQISSAIKFVEMGHGLCFATDSSDSYKGNSSVCFIPLKSGPLSRTLYLVTPKRRFMSLRHQRFIEILKEEREGKPS